MLATLVSSSSSHPWFGVPLSLALPCLALAQSRPFSCILFVGLAYDLQLFSHSFDSDSISVLVATSLVGMSPIVLVATSTCKIRLVVLHASST